MKKLIHILILIALISCESVKFQEQKLYDKYELPTIEEKGEQITFNDGAGTMWNSLFECGNFAITDKVAYSGKSSIKLDWNKANCEWIGFGNSFNNWQPVNLAQDRFKKALSFYVRTQSQTASSIPIVANLEDYGGGGSYYFIDASKYLYGLNIDTSWKQIIVPLWHFPIDEEEVDIASIKQMKFQLEGAGSFYLDEIKIIDFSEIEYKKMREEVEKMKPKGDFNQIVYRKRNFNEDVWGYQNNECQFLKEKTNNRGETFIHWKYENCEWKKWGINWNGWYAINLRGVADNSELVFNLKSSSSSMFKIYLQDFKGHKIEVFNSNSQKLNSNNWTNISISLSSLNLIEKGFVVNQTKQLLFEGEKKGEVFIKEIKIIKK